MENFSEGEVVIYEDHLKDRLVKITLIEADKWYTLEDLAGVFFRATTVDRLRKVTREALTNKILRLESSLTTLRNAMRNQNFSSTGLLK